jgi:cytochrome P450
MLGDLRAERSAAVPFPSGEMSFSPRRTRAIVRDPLRVMLAAYARHGPVFTLRVLHNPVVFMLGPAANHFMTVGHPELFEYRGGYYGDLLPLLGDGLLTIDGGFHRRSRRIMLPAFHRQRIAAARAVMRQQADRAVSRWADGGSLDLYRWTRELTLRVAAQALFGLADERDAARQFRAALDFWGIDFHLRVLRGPRTPWARMIAARNRLDELVYGEIARRRRTGERGEDLLSLLLDAGDEDGSRLSVRQVRDEVMTLLFAGHDTTTASVCFLFYELARAPAVAERVALDEALRLWPPAWIGPRRSVATFEFHGVRVPGGVHVAYSSLASHRLPEVWEQPDAFRPERWEPAARATLPAGAYIPFGAGSRTCIGMRFARQEVLEIAARVLRQYRLELQPGWTLRAKQMPTLGPADGMPVRTQLRKQNVL